MSAPVTAQAEELGLKHILNVTDLNIPFIFVSVVTTRRSLSKNPTPSFVTSEAIRKRSLLFVAIKKPPSK